MQAMAAESPATPADSAAFCGEEFKNSLFRIHTLKTSSQPDAQRLLKSSLAAKITRWEDRRAHCGLES